MTVALAAVGAVQSRTPSSGFPITTIFPVAFLLLAAASGVAAVSKPRSRIATGLGVLALVQLGSAVVSGQVNLQLAPFLVGVPLLAAATLITVGSPDGPDELIATVRRCSCAIVLGSIAFFVINPKVAMLAPVAGGNRRWEILGLDGRLAGLTPHPNLLGVTALLALLSSLHQRQRAWRLMIAAAAVAIVLAEARNAAITAFLLGVLHWALSPRARSRAGRLLLLGAVAVGSLALASGGAIEQIGATDIGSDAASLNSRTEVWEAVGDAWKEGPLLGWGPLAFDRRTDTPLSDSGFLTAHNQALQAIAEAGLIGLCALGVVLSAVIAAIAGAQRFFLLTGVLLFVTMLTETPLSTHQYGFNYVLPMGWLLMVLMVAAERDRSRGSTTSGTTAKQFPSTTRRSSCNELVNS